ncbi:LysM peptidoglycan-binding domain-containing protein [bacterium]|nr:MAG: LysM peptidoglycan-binding domain-containing protein [bacterium]
MKVSRLILLSTICIVVAGLTPRLVTQTLAETEKKEHIVQKGDTLWDISSVYLYDPFQWPRLWNVNRDIENPHLIYPGQIINIPMEIAAQRARPETARPELPPAPEPVEVVETKPAPEPEPVEEPVLETLPVAIQHEVIKALSTYGFIADKEEIGLGTITSQEEDRLLISSGQTVYVKSREKGTLETGERYSIVRVFEEVRHPVTRKRVGYLARILGDLSVVATNEDMATAVIGDIYLETMIGDKVMKHVQHLTWHRKTGGHPGVELQGFILASPDGKMIMGEGDVLFIDLGRKDGLGTGEVLWVRDTSAGTRGPELTGVMVPTQKNLGTIEVIIARDKTSVARITNSNREIAPGAKIISQ